MTDDHSTTGPNQSSLSAEENARIRLLADRLHSRGLDDETIRRLADEYIALDIGEDAEAFVTWAGERGAARP